MRDAHRMERTSPTSLITEINPECSSQQPKKNIHAPMLCVDTLKRSGAVSRHTPPNNQLRGLTPAFQPQGTGSPFGLPSRPPSASSATGPVLPLFCFPRPASHRTGPERSPRSALVSVNPTDAPATPTGDLVLITRPERPLPLEPSPGPPPPHALNTQPSSVKSLPRGSGVLFRPFR